MNALAAARFCALAGNARANSRVALSLKRMTLKLSPGARRATPRRSAARACSIDGPPMEPEVSMMKITSRGALVRCVICGGVSMTST